MPDPETGKAGEFQEHVLRCLGKPSQIRENVRTRDSKVQATNPSGSRPRRSPPAAGVLSRQG